MGHAICLQPWRTITGSNNTVVQDEADWVDVGAAKDVGIYIEVSHAHTNVHTVIQIETSPTKDETFFAGTPASGTPYIAQFDAFGATLGLQSIKLIRFASTSTTAPLSKYLRWSVTFAATDDEITFRIWLNVNAGGR
jgi:hypothetical protein